MSLTLKTTAHVQQLEQLRLLLAHGQLDNSEKLDQLQHSLNLLSASHKQLLEVVVPLVRAQAQAGGFVAAPAKRGGCICGPGRATIQLEFKHRRRRRSPRS